MATVNVTDTDIETEIDTTDTEGECYYELTDGGRQAVLDALQAGPKPASAYPILVVEVGYRCAKVPAPADNTTAPIAPPSLLKSYEVVDSFPAGCLAEAEDMARHLRASESEWIERVGGCNTVHSYEVWDSRTFTIQAEPETEQEEQVA